MNEDFRVFSNNRFFHIQEIDDADEQKKIRYKLRHLSQFICVTR